MSEKDKKIIDFNGPGFIFFIVGPIITFIGIWKMGAGEISVEGNFIYTVIGMVIIGLGMLINNTSKRE